MIRARLDDRWQASRAGPGCAPLPDDRSAGPGLKATLGAGAWTQVRSGPSLEPEAAPREGTRPGTHLQMLGPLTVHRNGELRALPASRKVRALLAYLALAPRAVGRSRLCELLWDVPNDPRGELRWCLSKIRSVLDEPARRRVATCSDTIRLDLTDCFVDVIEIAGAAQAGIETLDAERLRALSALFLGDFLDGLEIDRSPYFNGWLIAQRRRFRACHAAVLEHRVRSLPAASDETLDCLETWLEFAPLDGRAHALLLNALARRGRIGEGEEHLAATARLFAAEGLDWAPIRAAWQAARGRLRSVAPSAATAPARPCPMPTSGPARAVSVTTRRASIAVMPLLDRTPGSGAPDGLADCLARDVIARLARLRSLLVIAPGTVAALGERSVGADEAGRTLNVDYVASGSLRRLRDRVSVMIELAETRSARILWAEAFEDRLDDACLVLDQIGNRIAASIASEIETLERTRAIPEPPNLLDAW